MDKIDLLDAIDELEQLLRDAWALERRLLVARPDFEPISLPLAIGWLDARRRILRAEQGEETQP